MMDPTTQLRWLAQQYLRAHGVQRLLQIATSTTQQTESDKQQLTLAPSAVVLSALGNVRLAGDGGPLPVEQYGQLLQQLLLDQAGLQLSGCSMGVVPFPESAIIQMQENIARVALDGDRQMPQVRQLVSSPV